MSAPAGRAHLRKGWWGASVAGIAVVAAMVYGSAHILAAPEQDTANGSVIRLSADSGRSGTNNSNESLQRSAEQFTACMRSHGEPDFPGITISSNGTIQIDSSSVDIDLFSAQYQKAADACESLLPSGSGLPQAPKAPSLSGPKLNISCSGTACPAKPKVPSLPSLPS
jgi:hypothetical protein